MKQTFILQSINLLESVGISVNSITSRPVPPGTNYDLLYNGFGPSPKILPTHYLWYLFLKVPLVIPKKNRDFIDSIADWSINGKLMGTARALRWLRILRKIRKWRPNLIHVHFVWNLPPFIPVARFLDIPIVCTVRLDNASLYNKWIQHLRDPVVKRVLCVSDSIKNSIETKCSDLRSKTVRVFNPLNPIFLEAVTQPPADLRIVMVAAFSSRKNHAWLLDSLRVLKDRGVAFSCALLGEIAPSEPDVFDEMRFMAERLGISDRVAFRGWVSSEAVKEEFDQSTVLALPSTSEGLPNVVVEALARQRTPVVTDLPGNRDATDGGRFGFLVPLNDVEGLAEALLKAHDETVRQTQGLQSAREFVLRNLHPDVHLAELQKIYDAALAE